mmetsp:Transcript_101519/g.291356  ORF Transcript_101519/g.291356 Transcript_101519/m.291356 type:complete len:214 (-) Transcript_101519:454-1095(-)
MGRHDLQDGARGARGAQAPEGPCISALHHHRRWRQFGSVLRSGLDCLGKLLDAFTCGRWLLNLGQEILRLAQMKDLVQAAEQGLRHGLFRGSPECGLGRQHCGDMPGRDDYAGVTACILPTQGPSLADLHASGAAGHIHLQGTVADRVVHGDPLRVCALGQHEAALEAAGHAAVCLVAADDEGMADDPDAQRRWFYGWHNYIRATNAMLLNTL